MGTQFWIIAGGMVLAGAVLVAWPLLRHQRRAVAASTLGLLAAGVVLLYPVVSNYTPRSPAIQKVIQAESRDALASAADELYSDMMAEPDGFVGWRVLGNARLMLGQFPEAVFALRQAMERAQSPDPDLMLMLGEALTRNAPGAPPSEVAVLYIGAYQLDPNNRNAMFAAGLGFAAQGNAEQAADVWERLLVESQPADDIRQILTRQIAAWRGDAAPSISTPPSGRQIALQLALADAVARELPSSARLFVSVRDPNQPGPPLAAKQLPPSVLPTALTLSDADAMLAGRNLSSAQQFVITARISLSGDPLGGVGDLLGTVTLAAEDVGDTPLELSIDQVVQP
ncbi:MAG: hypothetical protein AAGL69_08815 [Pseudomonadota bacterium]